MVIGLLYTNSMLCFNPCNRRINSGVLRNIPNKIVGAVVNLFTTVSPPAYHTKYSGKPAGRETRSLHFY